MNLYQIEQELLDLYHHIEENEGEVTPEIEEQLLITQHNYQTKIENYVKFVKSLEGDISLIDSEIERILKLKQTKQNLIDRLKSNVLVAIQLFGIKDTKKDIWRQDLPTFKLSTRQSKSVDIPDESLIDRNFKEYSLSKLSFQELDEILGFMNKEHHIVKDSVSKTKIKKSIEEGNIVEGAILKTNYSLQIK